jgi:hypothetical protein
MNPDTPQSPECERSSKRFVRNCGSGAISLYPSRANGLAPSSADTSRIMRSPRTGASCAASALRSSATGSTRSRVHYGSRQVIEIPRRSDPFPEFTMLGSRGWGVPQVIDLVNSPSSRTAQLPKLPGSAVMNHGAPAPETADPDDMEAHAAPVEPLDPVGPGASSLSMGALRRSNPRQEPSALAAHARICAGGCPGLRRRAVPTAIPEPAGHFLTITGDDWLRNSLDRDHRNRSIAITENDRWRSPKPVHRDRWSGQSEPIPELIRGCVQA